jgi:hypothetical protein
LLLLKNTFIQPRAKDGSQPSFLLFLNIKKFRNSELSICKFDYLQASSIATATATVAPTIGLLPLAILHPLYGFLILFHLF